jgi:hypothetical protein
MTPEERATCIYECVCEHDPVHKDELVWQIAEHVRAAIREERERCAKIAEAKEEECRKVADDDENDSDFRYACRIRAGNAQAIAAAIRSTE